jgi:hypothetical protein
MPPDIGGESAKCRLLKTLILKLLEEKSHVMEQDKASKDTLLKIISQLKAKKY